MRQTDILEVLQHFEGVKRCGDGQYMARCPCHDDSKQSLSIGRTVRAMISAERRAGAAILSDNATGYYLPANEEEKARFVRSMRHRAKEILCAADAVERA